MQPTVIDDRYEIVEPLGSGGMAQVYLARDTVLDRDVALKVLRQQYAQDEEFVERFRQEARSAAGLSHPNVVSVYDQGRAGDGSYYMAMEYVPRGTLKDRIMRDGALEPMAAAGVALQVADALQEAHERGVIHRDIKPQNVLVTRSGDAKVADFGIARAAAANSNLTQTGMVLGTAGYMSPEQAKGEPVGPASDLYSLGVVLYEMLTGNLPYDAGSSLGLAMKHANEPPPSPREANPEVPATLDALTLKLLAKNPNDRYPSAAALADDLERIRAGLSPTATRQAGAATAPLPPKQPTRRDTARPIFAPPPRPPQPPERRRAGLLLPALATLLVALVLLLGGLAYALGHLDGFGLPGTGEPKGQSEQQQGTPTATVPVPDLTYMNAPQAADVLAGWGLALGAVGEAPSDVVLAGLVSGQNPAPGEDIEPGSAVGITVSTGPFVQQMPLQSVPVQPVSPAPKEQEGGAKGEQKGGDEGGGFEEDSE